MGLKISTLHRSLIPEFLRCELVHNWHISDVAPHAEIATPDHEPITRLFIPNGNAMWLLTELNPDTNVAFGLVDLGLNSPEIGQVSLDELEALAATEGFEIEVDLHFEAKHTLSQYAELAKAAGRIVD